LLFANLFAVAIAQLDPNKTYDNIIPPIDYDAKGIQGVGKVYTPVSTAMKCQFYLSHVRNETAKAYGLYVADWLALHGNQSGDYLYYPHDFPWPQYNLTKGWKSGLAQALVAECFMDAYEHTDNTNYLQLANKSLSFLRVPVSQRGVMVDEKNNRWWYEEYPSEGGSYVLNGHQFVLLTLNRYLVLSHDAAIKQLFDNGLKALKSDALQYDNGFNYSFYDRLWHTAKGYHPTHVVNFQKLYNITHDDIWLAIKKAFER
jgi:hypothetical protein